MEVKHTHPEYQHPQQRMEKLQDIQRVCIAAVAALRGGTGKHSA